MDVPQSIPRVLSRSDVTPLSQGLDAGDILECYALVRPAALHNTLLPNTPLKIHKVALGLRYRPLKATDESKYLEITLEYGPQRMGASLSQDSMPSVQREQQIGGGDEVPPAPSNSNDTDANGNTFLTWENEGKVYYTTQIQSTGYISAYYMASVTGAVLGKILEKAVDYPMANSHVRGRPRRYQPFVVVDGRNELLPPGFEGEIPDHPQRKVFLKSSSSTDFMHYMWNTLAELGVKLDPILAPPTYQVQLLASGVEKIRVGPPTWVTHSAAAFYDKLYMCIEAKVTGDYSKFTKPTPAPTLPESPSQAPSVFDPGLDVNNTDAPEEESHENDEDGRGKRILRADMPGTPEIMETEPPIDAVRDFIGENNNSSLANQTISEVDLTKSESSESAVDDTAALPPTSTVAIGDGSETVANDNATDTSLVPTFSPAPSSPPSWEPSVSAAPTVLNVNPQDTKNEVDEAQQAADQAKQAAAEAKTAAKTDVDSKAADAAQTAANAAQKAADATNNAAAQAAMDAFRSGSASSIVPIISPCFTDPQFGISTLDENGTLITHAYLYLDGSSYYKLNLTAPFIQVVPVEHMLPQPRKFGGRGEGGDLLDWTLALLLLFASCLGIIMFIQQVLGHQYNLIGPMYKVQLWFFNPLHYKDEALEEERKMAQMQQGGGQAYNFGADAIPFSMGGRRVSSPAGSPIRQLFRRTTNNSEEERERIPLNGSGEHQVDDPDLPEGPVEIEMTAPKTPLSRRNILRGRSAPVDQRTPQSLRTFGRGSSRASEESGDSESSYPLPNLDNTPYTDDNGIVGNLELVEKDNRIREKDLPSRLVRDPNLVEFPNLRSSSKVAVPAGLKRNGSFRSLGGNTL